MSTFFVFISQLSRLQNLWLQLAQPDVHIYICMAGQYQQTIIWPRPTGTCGFMCVCTTRLTSLLRLFFENNKSITTWTHDSLPKLVPTSQLGLEID
jgi:hypothetical protein